MISLLPFSPFLSPSPPSQAQKDHIDCVTALLSFPAVKDAADGDGRTALMWAAQRGNYNVLKGMLEREGDVHACDKLGATGKELCISCSICICVCCSVCICVRFRICICVCLSVCISVCWSTCICVCLSICICLFERLYLERFCVVECVLLVCLLHDIIEFVCLFVCFQHSTQLPFLAHTRCVQLLLQHSANLNAVDANGHTPLFRACERGHTEVVVMLGHAGALVDLQDANKRTCLHWAASGGHAMICSSLLHHGLPVDSLDSGG